MLAKLKSVNLIIGIFVGVLGTVATGTAIWTFFVSPYQLEAYALSVETPMPPNLRETLNDLNQFSLGDIRKRYSRDPDFPAIQDETLEAAIPVFSKIIKDRLSWSLKLTNKLNDHLTVITLRNGGRKTVRNVQLQMQYATQGSVILDRGDGKKEIFDFGGILKLGDVPPKSNFNIYLYSLTPYLGNGVVTHDEGIADISEYRPVPPFVAKTGGVFISYYWTTVVLAVTVGCLVILFLLRLIKNRKAIPDA
jgi:hypothetical protein